MLSRRRSTCRGVHQRGMSLVELMVGIAIGLIVVAAATLMVSNQLNESRRMTAELQLQQDLRAAMDIVTREVRRIGAQTDQVALQSLWVPGGTALENSHASPSLTGTSQLEFSYLPGNGQPSSFGFRLQGNAVQSKLGGWQELTDPGVLSVTALTITPRNGTPVRLPCPRLCPGTNDEACWPQVQVREFEITIEAKSNAFPDVLRTLSNRVRLRNDYVRFNNGATDLCPL